MLRRQRGRGVLTSAGFFLAACAFILLSATTQTTVLQATQIIRNNWRSTYDLVVLPSQTRLPTGQLIPPDQFTAYDGGISLQQYHQIQALPGVAVAAPIAFVSYALFPTVTLSFGDPKLPTGFYQLEWTLTAFNGFQHLIAYHSSTLVYGAPVSCTGNTCVPTNDASHMVNELGGGDYFYASGPYYTGVPNLNTFLIAAVDPKAENQLVHLDASIVQGKPLPEQTQLSLLSAQPYLTGDANERVPNYEVPLLLNTQLPGQLTLHASFVRFVAPTTDPQQVLTRGGSAYLDRLRRQTIFDGNVPIAQNTLKLLSVGGNLQQYSASSMHFQDNGYPYFPLNFVSGPAPLTYRPAVAPKGTTGAAYTLVPIADQLTGQPDTLALNGKQPSGQAEVAFRETQPLPGTLRQFIGTYGYMYDAVSTTFYNEASYTAQTVGHFDGNRLSATFSDALNWLPENTYTSFPTIRRYDGQGRPVPPTPLLSTTNPSGYLLQSPLALTTLAAAQQIRGPNCISVIRVRVTGNVSPDENGWKRVSQIAQHIHQRTGLQVLVTLGSSPHPTLVYIPGLKAGEDGAIQDIAPIGWVEEHWIRLGVGIVYLQQVGQTQLLLLTAVLLVCLGYLIVTFSALVTTQRRELAVLSALGWRPGHAVGVFLGQTLLLSLIGGILGIGVALLLVALIEASPPWQVVAWTLPVVLGLAFISMLYPLWSLWRIAPVEVLRSGTGVTAEPTSRFGRWNTAFWSHLPAVGGMALRNVTRSRWRAVIALGSLFLSAILLTVMVDGLLAFRQTLQGTLLGEYVLVQTAVPQLASAVFALLLTFLSVADLLLLQVRERQKEIGLLQAVGWRPTIVQRLFVQEGLTLALLGTVPGVVVALWVLNTQHATSSPIPAPVVAVGVVVVMLLVAGLATIPAVQAINRLPLSDVLRTE